LRGLIGGLNLVVGELLDLFHSFVALAGLILTKQPFEMICLRTRNQNSLTLG